MSRGLYRKLTLSLCISWPLLAFGAVSAKTPDLSVAKNAFQKKDYDKVIEILAPEVETLNREGLSLLAQAHSQKENSAAAIKIYTAAIAQSPSDAELKRLIGVEYMKVKGKDVEAKMNLAEAIKLDPSYEEAYIDMARFYEKKNNKYELRLLFEDLIQNPKVGRKPAYITRLCMLTTLEGQYTLSKNYCNEGIQINAKDPNNRVYLAMTMKETGNTEAAEKLFAEAADSNSKSSFAQLSAANFFVSQKNHQKALHYFKRASVADPKSYEIWQGLSTSSLELQKYDEVYNALTHACELNRSAMHAVRRVIAILRQQKNSAWLPKFEALGENCTQKVSI